MTTKPNTKQQAAHNRTLAALPLPSEEVLTPRRAVALKRHDAELYTTRLNIFRLSLSKGHIKIETVREMWLEWYGQYWDEVAEEASNDDERTKDSKSLPYA